MFLLVDLLLVEVDWQLGLFWSVPAGLLGPVDTWLAYLVLRYYAGGVTWLSVHETLWVKLSNTDLRRLCVLSRILHRLWRTPAIKVKI